MADRTYSSAHVLPSPTGGTNPWRVGAQGIDTISRYGTQAMENIAARDVQASRERANALTANTNLARAAMNNAAAIGREFGSDAAMNYLDQFTGVLSDRSYGGRRDTRREMEELAGIGSERALAASRAGSVGLEAEQPGVDAMAGVNLRRVMPLGDALAAGSGNQERRQYWDPQGGPDNQGAMVTETIRGDVPARSPEGEVAAPQPGQTRFRSVDDEAGTYSMGQEFTYLGRAEDGRHRLQFTLPNGDPGVIRLDDNQLQSRFQRDPNT